MLGFFIKKNFCDGWDNLLQIALYNVIFGLLAAGAYYAVGFVLNTTNEFAAIVCLFVCFAVFMVPVFAVSEASAKIADFKSVSIKEVFTFFLSVWKTAVLFGLLLAAIIVLCVIGIPFYMSFSNTIGIFLASVIFWIVSITLLSLQWFMPIYSRFHDPFLKTVKKSFVIFFDNAFFSVFMFFYSLILCAFSVFLAFLIPGISGIVLAYNNAFRLRLYKYDWLENHPELTAKQARAQIPWQELLAEDRETLGPRTLKSFIFPWKD